jgi:hypothetical protein
MVPVADERRPTPTRRTYFAETFVTQSSAAHTGDNGNDDWSAARAVCLKSGNSP